MGWGKKETEIVGLSKKRKKNQYVLPKIRKKPFFFDSVAIRREKNREN